MIKKTGICLLLLLLTFTLYPQDGGEAESEKEKKEEVKTIIEEWEETIKFGIADEVLKALGEIREAKETSLNPELVVVFMESLSDNLKIAILDFFIELEYSGLEFNAASILEEYEDYTRNFASRCIKYLAAIKSKELVKMAEELLDSAEDEIAIAAIQGLGDMEETSSIELLLEKFDDDEYANKRKPEIILSLGKIKATSAVPRLIEIIENKEEERIWRLYAADALGKIGDKTAVVALKKLFNEDDALVRAYAAAALSPFQLPDTVGVLIQGLKDSNWKVRIQAAKGLANKDSAAAIEILKYKVNKDPVKSVQLEAIRALGAISKPECFVFLRELYLDEKKSVELRENALAMLVEHDLEASLAAIVKVITPELDKKTGKSKILEATGTRLSRAESPHLEEVFALFLQSNSILIKVYGIRGAARNKLTSLKEQIQAIAADDSAGNVQKEALSALEKF